MGRIIDMKVDLAGIELRNPVMPASGTFGYGAEYRDLYDLDTLGALVTKSITKDERYGNELPRIAECTSGMLNSIGLQNPGLSHVLEHEIPELISHYNGPIIANISGFSIEEYSEVAEAVADVPEVDIIEVNISCPNVKSGGSAFGQDPKMSEEITRAVRDVTDKPIFIKLTPNVTDITEIALACEAGGADGLTLINNFKAMKIDVVSRKTVTSMKYAGISGPAIKPIALRMVNEVYHAVGIPLIGVGGVTSATDVIEMMMAGATAVQVGSENLRNPWACRDIIADLPVVMEKYDIDNIKDIIGLI